MSSALIANKNKLSFIDLLEERISFEDKYFEKISFDRYGDYSRGEISGWFSVSLKETQKGSSCYDVIQISNENEISEEYRKLLKEVAERIGINNEEYGEGYRLIATYM